MADYDHIIMRQVLSLQVADNAQLDKLPADLDRVMEERVMPLLAQLFSQYTPDDVVIDIDHLAVDLAAVSQSDFATDLPRRLQQQLAPLLQEKIYQAILDSE